MVGGNKAYLELALASLARLPVLTASLGPAAEAADLNTLREMVIGDAERRLELLVVGVVENNRQQAEVAVKEDLALPAYRLSKL